VAETPDVLVLDWVMPGVTGVDVCRFLRSAEGGLPQIGILLLTTHRQTEQIVEGLSAGANDYLAKPYADAELEARVHALLRTRQLLERAEQAEALSFKLLQLAPDPLLALDEERRIKLVNQAACVALAPRCEPKVGMLLSEVLPEVDRHVLSAQTKDTVALLDIKLGDRLFSPTLRALPSGKDIRTILSLRDITEAQRMAARRVDFYSIIAHDLRSPLSTLTLRTQLILGGRHGVLAKGLVDDLQKMDRNLQLLVSMINDFLDLARLDNVGYELEIEPVDLAALLDDTMADARPLLEARNLKWLIGERQTTSILGDARRLRQVMSNLISNAIKFTSERGTITTSVASRDGEVEVAISDTGRGIPAEDLSRIFERYTRGTQHTNEVPGTGLGLMIVREIIEAHRGRVGVESTLGQGSRFWFLLPRVQPEA
jgi:two-component system phosphate regulon sensor histidine kinase PhoR